MNVRLYNATIYLWNLTTNFDETWHEVHPYSNHGSWKVSFDFTHKQKLMILWSNFFSLKLLNFYWKSTRVPNGLMNPISRNFILIIIDECPSVSCNAISPKPDHQFWWNFPRFTISIWVSFMQCYIKTGGQVSEI